MTTTKGRARYARSRDAKRRAGRAWSRVAPTSLLALALDRSEQLASEYRLGRRKTALGRVIEMIWDIERVAKLSAAPVVREIMLAQREAQCQHPLDTVRARFLTRVTELEPIAEGRENLGTNMLLAGSIDLVTWREEYFWPELEVALELDALAEYLLGQGAGVLR